MAALQLGVHLAWRAGRISDHDALIGRKLAWILAGGSLPHETTVTEQYLLDLDVRHSSSIVVGERKTLARIQHTLEDGKDAAGTDRGGVFYGSSVDGSVVFGSQSLSS